MKLLRISLFLSLAMSAPAAAQDTFCDTVKVIILNSQNNFADIRGAKDEQEVSWEQSYKSTFIMPGASSCYIDDSHDQWSYSCGWTIGENKEDTARWYEKMKQSMKSCLKSSVPESEQEGSQGGQYVLIRDAYQGTWNISYGSSHHRWTPDTWHINIEYDPRSKG